MQCGRQRVTWNNAAYTAQPPLRCCILHCCYDCKALASRLLLPPACSQHTCQAPLTLTTLAVRPAAVEALPLVYTARGRKPATYLSSWLLAQLGSPMMATLMSPRRLMP